MYTNILTGNQLYNIDNTMKSEEVYVSTELYIDNKETVHNPEHTNNCQNNFIIALIKERNLAFDYLKQLSVKTPLPIDHFIFKNMISDMYDCLHSKIHPKNCHKKFVDIIISSIDRTHSCPLKLVCVLASPTATKEILFFLNFISIFNRYGINVTVDFLLIRWEYCRESQEYSTLYMNKKFKIQTEEIKKIITQKDSKNYQLSVIEIKQDNYTGEILGPELFRDSYLELTQLPLEDKKRARDLDWIKNFYSRQHSLSRLGVEQAILDLAIRRGIGRYIEEAFRPEPGILLTSELNARMLKCYNTNTVITNLSLRPLCQNSQF
ncbi:hypothetical protein [Vibrio quintilis]|uniref:Uncharacterized protein n=1 Tax=Vibrio quintilis TaxID=1117707 RepID=A0A1M7YVH5_9VIBR|nr:hypothetical protein [Vibrio quintilis]SHO56680.1 hypothetical protein VQ7734_02449 [Vibrio quintilis]